MLNRVALVVVCALLVSMVIAEEDACNQVCAEIYQPVCATTGTTYPNLCQFENDKCRLRRQMFVAYEGACETLSTSCENDVVCAAIYEPVCASDGTTYASACELNKAICSSFAPLTVVHQGACAADEICSQSCEKSLKPVCGSDGVSYDNSCLLVVASCLSKKTIAVAHPGRCDLGAASNSNSNSPADNANADLVQSCANVVCPQNKRCVDSPKQCVKAPCPQYDCLPIEEEQTTTTTTSETDSCSDICPAIYSPVCGSDFNTYSNECEMTSKACKLRKTVSVLHQGDCSQTDCTQIVCTDQYEPVCASVNTASIKSTKTLSNACELARETCQDNLLGSSVSVLHTGECTAADQEAVCDQFCTLEYAPVCLQGEDFANACLAETKACQLRITPSFTTGTCASQVVSADGAADNLNAAAPLSSGAIATIAVVAVFATTLLVAAVVMGVRRFKGRQQGYVAIDVEQSSPSIQTNYQTL